MITPDDVLREARRIARRRLSGLMLERALECINDDDTRVIANRKLSTELFNTEALLAIYIKCIKPEEKSGG